MLISRAWGDLSKFINPATFVREGWLHHENADLGIGIRVRMREKSTDCAEQNDEILKHNCLRLQLVQRVKGAELRCGWLALLGRGNTQVVSFCTPA